MATTKTTAAITAIIVILQSTDEVSMLISKLILAELIMLPK